MSSIATLLASDDLGWGAKLNIFLQGEPYEAPPQTTIAELLVSLDMQRGRVAVELNEEVVSRDQHALTALREGDRLEIVTLVGGG